MVEVVLAVKPLALAKTRMTEVSDELRADLVVAMLIDVLDQLAAADSIRSVTVVTGDQRVADVARFHGARVLAEPVPIGLNSAYSHAASTLARPLLALAADLPAVRAVEIDAVVAAALASVGGQSFVADHEGTGTVALFSASHLAPRFGRDSAQQHRLGGANELFGHWPGLRLDVDSLADLAKAATLTVGPATNAIVAKLKSVLRESSPNSLPTPPNRQS